MVNWDLIIRISTLVVLIIYAYYTYKIAKDNSEPVVSITLKQIEKSHIQFHIKNNSKVETESFVKIIAEVNNEFFEFKSGFYGDKSSWVLQPFSEGNGHFQLLGLENNGEDKIGKFIDMKEVYFIKFYLHLKYRKAGSFKWKVPQSQKWIYNFKSNVLWLDV